MAVIKTALMLERGFVLPNFDFKKPNEQIPFTQWNIKVPVSQRPWPRGKRFASVNNFGFGQYAEVIHESAADRFQVAPTLTLFWKKHHSFKMSQLKPTRIRQDENCLFSLLTISLVLRS
jgi:acyl transferase domain-containing protein